MLALNLEFEHTLLAIFWMSYLVSLPPLLILFITSSFIIRSYCFVTYAYLVLAKLPVFGFTYPLSVFLILISKDFSRGLAYVWSIESVGALTGMQWAGL